MNFRLLARSIATAAPVALMSVPGVAAAAANAEVVARLGMAEFTADSLSSFVRSLDPKLRSQALADRQLMTKLVGLELARIAVLNEAKAKKWPQRPDVVRQIERARDDAIYESYLGSVAAPDAGYPSEAEIQSAYELNRDSFMAPRQYRLEQIFIASPANAAKEAAAAAEKKAQDLARRAKAGGANFTDLARANSEHRPSAEKGGDLGWAAQTQIMPEIGGQVAGMDKGEISDPIRSAAGWHIVRMVDTRPAAPRPLSEVRQTLIAMLKTRKRQEKQQAYIARLLDKAPIAVNEARLRALFEAAP
jgi:parvulin-like peptidyl-prolyl isomerase